MTSSFSRRRFMSSVAALTAGFSGLKKASAMSEVADGWALGYGPLQKGPDGFLAVPKGFTYTIISTKGELMNDGLRVPAKHDGMGSFAGPNGTTLLIRNHETTALDPGEGPMGKRNDMLPGFDRSKFYDPGIGDRPCTGGTTTLVYDTKNQKLVSHHLSLTGTLRNCAGGTTPWGTWITCEETEVSADGKKYAKDHGYNFEVPASAEPGLADPIPLKEMGRFNHEAVAVDPKTGIVYQTEDKHAGLIMRYIPNTPGKLHEGGRLEALVVLNPTLQDTRNWPQAVFDKAQTGNAGNIDKRDVVGLTGKAPWKPGRMHQVAWIALEDIDNPKSDLRYRGFAQGAARFARGEGAWFGEGVFYFACTNGGQKLKGQIFRYRPSPFEGTPKEVTAPGTLELYIEANNDNLLENADNITVAPWGDMIVCEDTKQNDILGITPHGEVYHFAKNIYNSSEFAGACFSVDGTTLFVNMQTPGLTFAITGPWLG